VYSTAVTYLEVITQGVPVLVPSTGLRLPLVREQNHGQLGFIADLCIERRGVKYTSMDRGKYPFSKRD
jgi:hypothetical protein